MGISKNAYTALLYCATEPLYVAKSLRMTGALQGLPVLCHISCTRRTWKLRALQRYLANWLGARWEALHSQPLSLLVDKRGPRLSTDPHMSRLFNSLHGYWHSFGPGHLAHAQKTTRLDTTHSTRQVMLPERLSTAIPHRRKACLAICTWAMLCHFISRPKNSPWAVLFTGIGRNLQEPPLILFALQSCRLFQAMFLSSRLW